MKKTQQYLLLAIMTLSLSSLQWCSHENKSNGSDFEQYSIDKSDFLNWTELIADSAITQANEEEKNWLIKMREEEKLAHDVYLTLWKKWWIQIFTNISNSEKTHTEAIKTLIEKYWINDPVASNEVWVFSNSEFKDLFDKLTTKWNISIEDALQVWALIEDLDIYDLDNLLKTTKNQNIILVYKNLQKWSRNHLRAFVKNIIKKWWSYKPSYILDKDFESIISSKQEKWRINL